MVTSDKILKTVNEVSEINITEKSRNQHAVWCRWIYFHITEKYTGAGPSFIARQINKNHATVIHGLNNINEILKIEKYKKIHETVLEKLNLIPPKLDVFEFEINKTEDSIVDYDTLNIIINKLKHFNSEKLNYFLKYRIEPFIKTYSSNTSSFR